MVREGLPVQDDTSSFRVFEDRAVRGLENGVGRFVHGIGPGTHGAARPIPLFFQVLDPRVFDLSFRPGDETYQVLSNDQQRFPLPRSLPPILSLMLPGDDDEENAAESFVIARHPYSEGAFNMLYDLLEDGYRFSLKEFLKLFRSLAEALAFLHDHGIAHGQWNARSVVCVPTDNGRSPFDSASSYRFDLINTGVRYRDPTAIPPEYIERGYYPPEIFPPSTQLPDCEALDVETDIYCFTAFLRDLFHSASRFEELTQQAGTIRDYFCREAIRRGSEPSKDALRRKEQEILDHLYTLKVKTEDLIQKGLSERGRRTDAASLARESRELHEKALEYADRLFEIGFDSVNVFGGELEHYVPFQVQIEPEVVNNLDDTIVTLKGDNLPYELVRVSLGESDTLLDVVDARQRQVRFRIPSGFPTGTHRVLINNRRTNVSVEVVSPRWEEVVPRNLRRPWDGFGNLAVTVKGWDVPAEPAFALEPAAEALEAERLAAASGRVPESERGAGGAPQRIEAVSVQRLSVHEDGEADAASSLQSFLVEFPPSTPLGEHELMAGELPTGLAVTIEEALPNPEVDEDGIDPAEVLNHREQRLTLRGRNLHPAMLVDFGEDAPGGVEFHPDPGSNRVGEIVLPAAYPPGEYVLRINRKPTPARIVVCEPVWSACEPPRVHFPRRAREPATLAIRGGNLPLLDEETGDLYSLRAARSRRPFPHGVLEQRALEETALHEIAISPRAPRGHHRIYFGDRDTGLDLRVRRQLPRSAVAVPCIALLALLGFAGFHFAERLEPRVASLIPETVYNFEDPLLIVRGERLRGLRLEAIDGTTTYSVEIASAPGEAAASDGGGEAYSFRLSGIPPGTYRAIPEGWLGSGDPARATLTVLSPALRLIPDSIHRFFPAELTLESESGFPVLERVRTLGLRPLAASPADEPLIEESLVEGKLKVGAELFDRRGEGSYLVLANGRPLGEASSASGEPVSVTVVGPRMSDVRPRQVTVDGEGRIRIQLDGTHLPDGIPLGLVEPIDGLARTSSPAGSSRAPASPGGGRPIRHRLAPTGDGAYEGPAAPGIYDLAWDRGAAGVEEIPQRTLSVLPPPAVTAVAPRRVRPDVPVHITFAGQNLRGAETIGLHPASGAESAIEIALDPDRLLRQADGTEKYEARDLVLRPGSYSVLPGTGTVLEVVEDCRELLKSYRSDLSEREKLIQCLQDADAPAYVRKAAADVFFDQGLFTEAARLYEKLEDVQSRFRAAFLKKYIGGAEEVSFAAVEGELSLEPYIQAAAALGWIPGAEGKPPADPNGPWELDFVRGVLAEDPRARVEALSLSIEKKKTAAEIAEEQPFPPARELLAAANLDLVVYHLIQARPLAAQEHLRSRFIDGNLVELLGEPDRARFHFVYGHIRLWYFGDEEGAQAHFRDGFAPGGGEYRSLCRLYLEGLGAPVPPAPLLYPPLPAWERDFLTAFGYYRRVLRDRNFNILTEVQGRGLLTVEEQKASEELHGAIRRLEETASPTDPFAHYAVLFYVRNAQRLSWPGQSGLERAMEHSQRFQAIQLEPFSKRVRDFYLLQAEVGPLETPQVLVLADEELRRYDDRIRELLSSDIPGFFKSRLREMGVKISS